MFEPILVSSSDNEGKLGLGIGIDVFELLDEANIFEVLLVVDQELKELLSCCEAAVPELELVVQGDEAAGELVLLQLNHFLDVVLRGDEVPRAHFFLGQLNRDHVGDGLSRQSDAVVRIEAVLHNVPDGLRQVFDVLFNVVFVIHIDFALKSLEIANAIAFIVDALALEYAYKDHPQRIDVSSIVVVLSLIDPIIHVSRRTYS